MVMTVILWMGKTEAQRGVGTSPAPAGKGFEGWCSNSHLPWLPSQIAACLG